MSPDTLNMILILKANKVLWSNETSLQDILDNTTADEDDENDHDEDDDESLS